MITPQIVQEFIDSYDPTDRWIRARLVERLHGEIYRREREIYPEWVDQGGEA